MSWKATAYVKDVLRAPNGQKITCSEKLIMFVLADCYNEDYQQAWPSVQRLASAALMTERHARRVLRTLEAKGLVQTAPNRGSGHTNTYRFPGYSQDVTKGKPDKMSGLLKSETGRADCRNRTPEREKPDSAASGKPRGTETGPDNGRQDASKLYRRELTDMRRAGPIGDFARKLWRERLADPAQASGLPDWFRREASSLVND
jgi:Helix-turn-helix domain